MVLRQKDNFFAIKPFNGILIAYDLYFPAQIRDTVGIERPAPNGFDQETFDLAKSLVEKMTKPFDQEEIKDEYTGAMRKIIEDKAAGKTIDVVEIKEEQNALSLKEALKGRLASLDGRIKRTVDFDDEVQVSA